MADLIIQKPRGRPKNATLVRNTDAVICGYRSGDSLDKLAKKYNASAGSVRRLLIEHGVPTHPPKAVLRVMSIGNGFPDRLYANRILLTRLFSKITISTKHFYKDDPCWDWQSERNHLGYAQYRTASQLGVTRLVHRLLYSIFVELPRPEAVCDHLCRRPCCVNPVHIEAVTQKVNMQRAVFKPKPPKLFCPQGHAMIGDNLYVRPSGDGYNECVRCRTATYLRVNALRRAATQLRRQARQKSLR